MNTTAITGRLARSPETNATPTGTSVCELRIAVDDRTKASFLPVIFYGPTADTAAQYLTKGRLVAITGRLVNDEWTTTDGERRSRLYIVGRSLDFLDAPHPETPDTLVGDSQP